MSDSFQLTYTSPNGERYTIGPLRFDGCTGAEVSAFLAFADSIEGLDVDEARLASLRMIEGHDSPPERGVSYSEPMRDGWVVTVSGL